MKPTSSRIAPSAIETRILTLRGQKVLLDVELAVLYGVPTKVLLQAVRRNRKRFPADFMFQIERQDVVNLRSQIVTSSYGGRRYMPYAFTQEGVAMLSGVLRSPRAVAVNIEIMRAFVRQPGYFMRGRRTINLQSNCARMKSRAMAKPPRDICFR